MYNEEVQSEYTPVELKQDKKHENDPMETTLFYQKIIHFWKNGADNMHSLY